MKTNFINENTIIVFLNHFFVKDLDFTKKEKLEVYFKKIFLQLNERYHIEVNGYYNITVYPDRDYGAILYIEKEDLDYMELWDNQVDMRIAVSKFDVFVYQITDVLSLEKPILQKGKVYYEQGYFYYQIEKPLNEREMGNLLEMSTVCYGLEADHILRYGKMMELQQL